MRYLSHNQPLCDDQSILTLTSTLTRNHLSRKNHQILIGHSTLAVKILIFYRGKSIPKTASGYQPYFPLQTINKIRRYVYAGQYRLRFYSSTSHRQWNNRVCPKSDSVRINCTRKKSFRLKYDKYIFILSNII